MRAMNLPRPARASLATLILTGCAVSLFGACTTNGEEVCGINGVKNGTCEVGPTCPSGSVLLPISDPVDECPGSNAPAGVTYICCVPESASSGTPADAGKHAG